MMGTSIRSALPGGTSTAASASPPQAVTAVESAKTAQARTANENGASPPSTTVPASSVNVDADDSDHYGPQHVSLQLAQAALDSLVASLLEVVPLVDAEFLPQSRSRHRTPATTTTLTTTTTTTMMGQGSAAASAAASAADAGACAGTDDAGTKPQRRRMPSPVALSAVNELEQQLKHRLERIIVVDGKENEGALAPVTYRGILHKQQLTKQLQELSSSTGKNMKEIFKTIDVRGTGTVSHAAFGSGLTALGIFFDKEEMEALVWVLDGDGDGEIDYVEFCKVREGVEGARNGE